MSALGKGLSSLIPNKNEQTVNLTTSARMDVPVNDGSERVEQVSPNLVKANPWQPRSNFDRDRMEELVASIKNMVLFSR